MPRIPRPRISKRVWLVLAGVFGVLVLSGGSAVGALAATGHLMASSGAPPYCVTSGHGISAAGNVVEFNWDGQACPAGTYPHSLVVADPDSTGTTETDDDSGFLPNTFNTGGDPLVATPTTWTVLDYFDLSPTTGQPMKITCQYAETSQGIVAPKCEDVGFLP